MSSPDLPTRRPTFRPYVGPSFRRDVRPCDPTSEVRKKVFSLIPRLTILQPEKVNCGSDGHKCRDKSGSESFSDVWVYIFYFYLFFVGPHSVARAEFFFLNFFLLFFLFFVLRSSNKCNVFCYIKERKWRGGGLEVSIIKGCLLQ